MGGYLDDPAFLDDPDRLENQLTTDAAGVAGGLSQAAERRSAGVLSEFSEAHNLRLSSPTLRRLPAPPVPQVPDFRKPDSDASARSYNRDMHTHMMAKERLYGALLV